LQKTKPAHNSRNYTYDAIYQSNRLAVFSKPTTLTNSNTNLCITLPRFRVKVTWLLKNKVAHKPANVALTKALSQNTRLLTKKDEQKRG